jgi:hypothetical protein
LTKTEWGRPNKALQPTGHAIDVASNFNAVPRVSRLLSMMFGPSKGMSH